MKYFFLIPLLFFSCIVSGQKKGKKISKSDMLNAIHPVKDKMNGKVRIPENNKILKSSKEAGGALQGKKQTKEVLQVEEDLIKKKTNLKPFDTFKEEFIEQLWILHPNWASHSGYHKFDAVLELPNEKNRLKNLRAYNLIKQQLQAYDKETLSAVNKTDYAIIENHLESSIWYINEYRNYEWDPSVYNIGGDFDAVLQNEKDEPKVVLKNIFKKLGLVPQYYEMAKANLKTATIEHTELALEQIPGSLPVFQDQIIGKINESDISDDFKNQLMKNLKIATDAIEGFTKWLEEDYLEKLKLEGNARSFRIGKELYAQKFKYNINSDFSATTIYERAVAEKETVLQKMEKIAINLWPKYFPDEGLPEKDFIAPLIKKIAENHVERDDFISAIENQLPELKKFVEEKDLVFLDHEKPLEVRETPGYMAGVAGASISAPGPYEKDKETFYNVTPLTNYTDEEAESYLREYNFYMLQILNIHEAIPGHYTQLVEANKSPSLVKSILGNGTMIEGWACYAERMMLEEGYGNQEPEMWLMYYKWLLRIISNTILDYSLHNLDLNEADALDMLVNEAFQEKTEAVKKIKRAKLSQVQLCSYYTGLSEILDLREAYFEENGKNLRKFHDEFLKYGSSPVREIRKLMKLN